MKPSATGALITEATVRELHQVTPVAEMGGVAQMEAKYVHLALLSHGKCKNLWMEDIEYCFCFHSQAIFEIPGD